MRRAFVFAVAVVAIVAFGLAGSLSRASPAAPGSHLVAAVDPSVGDYVHDAFNSTPAPVHLTPLNAAVGDTLFAYATLLVPGASTPTIGDSAGNSWTIAVSQGLWVGSTDEWFAAWYSVVTVASASDVITLGGWIYNNAELDCVAVEIANAAGFDGYSGVHQTTVSGATTTSLSWVTNTSNDVSLFLGSFFGPASPSSMDTGNALTSWTEQTVSGHQSSTDNTIWLYTLTGTPSGLSGAQSLSVSWSPSTICSTLALSFGPPSGPAPSAPPAPTGLTPTYQNTTDVFWTWTQAAGGGILDDTLYFFGSPTCGGPWTVFDLGGPGTSYDTTSLTPGTAYSADVTATNSTGEGPPSSCVDAATAALAHVPPAPTYVDLTYRTQNVIDYNWTNPVGLVTDNYMYLGLGPCTHPQTFTTTATSDGLAISSSGFVQLTPGTSYCLAVSAWNATGESALAFLNASTLPAVAPPAPTNFAAVNHTSTTITWGWTQSTGTGLLNATVRVWQAAVCGGDYKNYSASGPAVILRVAGLTPGTSYAAEVEVWNASGASPFSTCAVNATLAHVTPAPVDNATSTAWWVLSTGEWYIIAYVVIAAVVIAVLIAIFDRPKGGGKH